MKKLFLLAVAFLVLFASFMFAGTTGKIAGTIADADNGEPLPGVNVLLEGTTLGAVTNAEGYYVILNVPPGIYTIKASYIGYTAYRVTNAAVKIDLTTTIDFKMNAEVIAGEEVVVVAQRPIVVKDIAASQANLNIKEVEAIPVVSVAGVVGLQAGIRGLEIRGGEANQTVFMLNGITLRDERDNTPYTGISYTAIEEIQVQTGGFNAEFGNIRSGLINVVTKEGKKDRYSFNFLGRYSAPAQKHFGASPNARDSYWIRPYVDEAVCWTGTNNGAWDEYTKRQYQPFPEGFNGISRKTLEDKDPTNDLTPEAAQRLFLWEHRRQLDIDKPDYDIDVSLGGPFPIVSSALGNLRFYASYRTARDMYVIPLSRDSFQDYNAQIKITSDLKQGMKLILQGLRSQAEGTNDNNSGLPGLFRSPESIANNLDRDVGSFIDTRIFATDYWAPSTITRNSVGVKFTHAMNARTFYDITLDAFQSQYDTNPGRRRDNTRQYLFGNTYLVDEAPFGFEPVSLATLTGMRTGAGMSDSRDSSAVTVYNARFDMTSQMNRYANLKAGLEFVYTDNNVNYGRVSAAFPGSSQLSQWHTFPVRGAAYAQTKLEFEGMIANLGLRLDYSHAGGTWYEFDNFPLAFSSRYALGLDTLLTKSPTDRIFNLSPRLGIAFPITVNSKLYFNYGHFRQMPLPENLFLVRRNYLTDAVIRIANPNNPLQKTVAYELGYEHNLFEQFLLRLAGYYKDVSQQSRLVNYVSEEKNVNYSVTEPNSYEDIRGAELTLSKNRGAWVQGFVNYTYLVNTSGNFRYGRYTENITDQAIYEGETRSHYQERPIARPYARVNVDFFTAKNWGPKLLGVQPLEDWRLNILGDWRAGYHFTWAGGGSIPGVVNNIQWRDFYNVNLRLSKALRLGGTDVQFFMDVNNLFNLKYMTEYGFIDANDFRDYMRSLHLPAEVVQPVFGYLNIPGNDRPGDFRTGPYIPWDDNADESTKAGWRKNKSYIDMPNQQFLTFLNPRDIFFGLKVTFDVF